MDTLPDDILLEIFSYLPQTDIIYNIRPVCGRWRELSYAGDLWQTIDLTKEKDKSAAQAAMVSNLKHVQDHVKTLTVAPCLLQNIFNNDLWQFLTLKQLNLTSLNVRTTCVLGEPNLRYPRLEKLSFESSVDSNIILTAFAELTVDTLSWECNEPFTNIRNSILTLNKMHNLHKIRVRMNYMDNETINHLIKNCQMLMSLEVYTYTHNPNITDEAFLSLTDKCQLSELALPLSSITDTSLKNIAENCKNLKTINISYCYQITDAGIKSLTESCKQLENISIGNIPNITRWSTRIVANNCHSLKYLDVKFNKGVENETMTLLLEKCQKLVKLDISSCQNITKSWLLPTTNECVSNVISPAWLREISINGNTSINADAVIRLLTCCESLRILHATECLSIGGTTCQDKIKRQTVCSRKTLRRTDNNNKHSHLILTDFSFSANVEDSTIITISELCPDLRIIQILGCKKITTMGVQSLFKNCCFVDKVELRETVLTRSNCTFGFSTKNKN